MRTQRAVGRHQLQAPDTGKERLATSRENTSQGPSLDFSTRFRNHGPGDSYLSEASLALWFLGFLSAAWAHVLSLPASCTASSPVEQWVLQSILAAGSPYHRAQ